MNFFAQIGIGLLVNIVTSATAGSQAPQFQAMQMQQTQSLQRMRESIQQRSMEMEKLFEEPSQKLKLDADLPKFPQETFDSFQSMQYKNFLERENFVNDMNSKLNSMKEDFFNNNHCETTVDNQGKLKVALDENGKPMVKEGAEDAAGKEARINWENSKRSSLEEMNSQQRVRFQQEERRNLETFLQANKFDLGNPAIQAEIQKMVLLSQKKQLRLQREQDIAQRKVDLPTDQMVSFVDESMEKLGKMEEEHQSVEENSSEAVEIASYRASLEAAFAAQRQKLNETKQEEAFLKKPVFNQTPDLMSQLPPNIGDALVSIGIYSL